MIIFFSNVGIDQKTRMLKQAHATYIFRFLSFIKKTRVTTNKNIGFHVTV